MICRRHIGSRHGGVITSPPSRSHTRHSAAAISGVEVAVNTSFNVAAPIAQSPVQALGTLRRANGMDGVFIFSDDGPVVRRLGQRTKNRCRRTDPKMGG